MKYEVIIFDADDTLFDFKKSEQEAFKNTMLEFDIAYQEDYHLPIYHKINSAIWKEFEEGKITQQVLKVERFRRLSNKLNIEFNEYEFAIAYMKHLANASYLFDDSIPFIQKLHKDYRLIILTNGLTNVQTKRIKQSIIANYFESIIISEEVGVSKPDPRIFELALESIHYTDKSKVLMVGDSLTSDIKGGINFGVDTCWINRNHVSNTTNIKPTYEILNWEQFYNSKSV